MAEKINLREITGLQNLLDLAKNLIDVPVKEINSATDILRHA